jgi:class 3 adenylate cyclase/tetratricopeptide (TPR) repeat protein
VSVLFVDLVGFTTASEARDAEDTRELLTRYFDLARTTIERYGGTVEKFIGDAVMAVWGAPVANEDDAERSVRAALDLVAAVPVLDASLQARAGVLTGEAAVTVGAQGQGMVAGDLVNTAARIQSAAEPGTVLVGEATKRSTEAALAYEGAGAHELKGKAEAVALWRAIRVVAARRGEGRSVGLEAPFVGREREFRRLKDALHATGEDRRATLVTIVGVAGIGKSRLAWELEKYVDGLADDVYWHRGRCLSYGDGVAHWALAEMVRMRARITEDETEGEALSKLRASVAEHVDEPGEREWVETRLQQLLGLVERSASDRDDLYAAWRLYFERIAAGGTVVLVFEDVHWADAGLVEFVEHLLEGSRSFPICVVALARPELAERYPGFGRSARNAVALTLEALDADAMDALLTGLVPGLGDDLRGSIRERADGIPLYAVELVRMLIDRGALVRRGDVYVTAGDTGALEVPETLHALIAARLDGLQPGERELLESAAVLGKTFTREGLAAVSGADPARVEQELTELVRKEVLFLEADPRSPERGQYGFLQALVQRVAYERLSRRDRKARHLACAGFLAGGTTIDPDEIADVVAAHYRDAAALDPAAEDAVTLRGEARAWLVRAGERAAALAATEDARRAFDEAVSLADDPEELAALLERAGDLALAGSDPTAAEQRLREAHRLFVEAGRTHDAARVAAGLSLTLWAQGRGDETIELLDAALEVLADDAPDADLARLAAEAARVHHFLGHVDTAMERVELALTIAEAHDFYEALSEALNTKALLLKGRPHESRALMREALQVALEHDLVQPALRAYNNMCVLDEEAERYADVRAHTEAGLELARRRGHRSYAISFAGQTCANLLEDGDWDEAFRFAGEQLPDTPSTLPGIVLSYLMLAQADLDRGNREQAHRWLALGDADLGETEDFQQLSLATLKRTLIAIDEGRLADALALSASNIRLLLDQGFGTGAAVALETCVTLASDLGRPDELRPVVAEFDTLPQARRIRAIDARIARAEAVVAAAAGDDEAADAAFARSLAAARSDGRAPVVAQVLADYGRWLAASGRPDEATELLAEARTLFERMGARVWLDRLERALPVAATS